ncbi:MAG: 2-dehydropantoate 2-reductase N-terminal domain-containing protein [Dehalococcoidia bacterium]
MGDALGNHGRRGHGRILRQKRRCWPRAGQDVTFIARGAHLAAMQTAGLRVRSTAGDFDLAVRATGDAARIGAVDVVVLP